MADLLTVDENGNIKDLFLSHTQVPLRNDDYAQAIVFEDKDGEESVKFTRENDLYVGYSHGIRFEKKASVENGRLTCEICVRTGERVPDYKYIDFRSGIDSYMVQYPLWDGQFFPTFMRCEKTHFWGYYSRTDGKKLAVVCDGKLVSWRNYYNRVYYDPENPDDPGHRVYTTSFSLFSTLKQPARHPENKMEKNAVYSFKFVFGICDTFEELNDFYDSVLNIRLTKAKKWTIERGESISFVMDDGEYTLTDEGGVVQDLNQPLHKCGRYYLTHKKGARQSQSLFFVREEPIAYLRTGAIAAMKREQFASTNCETYYGFFAIFAYLCEVNDVELLIEALNKLEVFLHTILKKEGDLKDEANPRRIQNYTTVISILVLAYRASKDQRYLDIAEKLAKIFIKYQGDDGAYYSRGVHYTCVIYPAKSLFELCAVLKETGRDYEEIYSSAMLACNNLRHLKTRIGTEGEHTFEDGMISCESMQLALAGLLSYGEERRLYAEAAEEILSMHKCLEVEYVPDARYRGATLRHWEAHYDILCSRNMMTSPHGWTSWKTYAQYYLYELTNNPDYLINYFDTLGACLQCADTENDEVNWAFVIDPCVEAKRFVECENGGILKGGVFGEEYLSCISPWWRADPYIVSVGYGDPRFGNIEGRAHGACCDNDVFEHFKCLQEVGMHAVLHETDDEWIAYNCKISDNIITVSDRHVKKIRIYSKRDTQVFINGIKYALMQGVNYLNVNEN